MSSSSLSRRALLSVFAATPLVTTGIGVFPATARPQAAEAGLITPNVCMLTPETTEGPFYLDPGLVRQDIREDRPGMPMNIALQVVRPRTRRPLVAQRVRARLDGGDPRDGVVERARARGGERFGREQPARREQAQRGGAVRVVERREHEQRRRRVRVDEHAIHSARRAARC